MNQTSKYLKKKYNERNERKAAVNVWRKMAVCM